MSTDKEPEYFDVDDIYAKEPAEPVLGKSVHPKTKEGYNKLGLPVPDTVRLASLRPYERMLQNIEEVTGAKPEENFKVTNMYRLKDRQKKEWLCYKFEVRTTDLHGNMTKPAQYSIGSYQIPEGRSIKDPRTFRVVRSEIEGKKQVFEIPWNTKEVDKLIARHVKSGYQPEDIHLTVAYSSTNTRGWTQPPSYAVKNLEDFKTGTFEELFSLGQRGLSSPEPSLERLKQPIELDPEVSLVKRGKIR